MTEIKKETMENFLQLARDAVKQKDYDTATDHLISVLQFDSSNSEAFGIMGDMAFSKKDLNSTVVFATLQIQAPHVLVSLVALRGKFKTSEIVAFGGIEVFL